MRKELITIGFISYGNTEHIIHSINMIMTQKYSEIELIICIDDMYSSSACCIIDCINMHKKENIKSVEIHINKDNEGTIYSISYIYQKAKGKYITFLNEQFAYIDIYSLDNMMNKIVGIKGLIDHTIVINQGEEIKTNFFQNRFINKAIFCFDKNCIEEDWLKSNNLFDLEDIEKKLMQYMIKNKHIVCSTKKVLFSTEYNKLWRLKSCIPLKVSREKFVFNNIEIEDKYLKESYKMNYSRYIYFHELINKIIAQNNDSNIERYREEIQKKIHSIIEKQKGGYWSITDGDYVFIYYMQILKSKLEDKKYKESILLSLLNEAKKQAEERIKLLFLTEEYSTWNSLKSIYDFALKDERYIVDLVHIPYKHPNKSNLQNEVIAYQNAGYKIFKNEDYNISRESPDIIILSKPYSIYKPKAFCIEELIKVIERCIFSTYTPGTFQNIQNEESTSAQRCKLPINILLWKNITCSYSETLFAERYSFGHGENCLKIGHPRYDINKYEIEEEDKEYFNYILNKAKGRKIILWNTQHKLNGENGISSFLYLGNKIIEYFVNNQNLFLLWRPHPLFEKSLKKEFEQKNTDIDPYILEKVGIYQNILVDTYKSYIPGILSSSAMISDESSIVIDYLLTKKPILLTFKKEKKETFSESLINNIYIATEEIHVEKFINMIVQNKDDMLEKRLDFIRREFYMPKDKITVAEILLEYINTEIIEEEKNAINRRVN